MNNRVAIIGVGWSGFRPTSSEFSYKELIYNAAIKAYSDAGVDPRRDIESFVTVAEDFYEGTSIFDEYTPDQLGAVLKPVHTIGGDGLHGLATAYMLIRTGQFSIVVVEGHSKASNILTFPNVVNYAQDPVLNRPLRLNYHFIAGLDMNRFLSDSGNSIEACAEVTVKNRQNALINPSAPYGVDLSLSEVLSGDPTAWPLNNIQTSQHADGAIILVLASEDKAKALTDKPVWISGVGWCNDSYALENRTWGEATYAREAARMAFRQAGIRNPTTAIDFAEVDDTYAFKELQSLEAMGVFPKGEAGKATLTGFTRRDGEFPVNVSGGSQGFGDLLDANGLARALEVVLQLRGEAGSRQLQSINTGLVQSWRGVPTASGAVAILNN
jgi:acetyl-CoA C-acetyltransferase